MKLGQLEGRGVLVTHVEGWVGREGIVPGLDFAAIEKLVEVYAEVGSVVGFLTLEISRVSLGLP